MKIPVRSLCAEGWSYNGEYITLLDENAPHRFPLKQAPFYSLSALNMRRVFGDGCRAKSLTYPLLWLSWF